MQLLFIHGRAQEGRSAAEIEEEWLRALRRGMAKKGKDLPAGTTVATPFYGDILDDWQKRKNQNPNARLNSRGSTGDDDFEDFLYAIAEEAIAERNITDEQLAEIAREEEGVEFSDDDLQERGPQNWRSVRLVAKALDGLFPGATSLTIRAVLYDVHIYLKKSRVWKDVHEEVKSKMTADPTVVVAHSLGTVVAYRMLMGDAPLSNLRQLITLGSPLGIRAISNQVNRGTVPHASRNWYNALDPQDIVALRALDHRGFPTAPPITNNASIDNHTDNQHSIGGYLDDENVANEIHMALSGH